MEKELPGNYFGRNLRFLRKSKGLSQQKLAELFQLNRNNIASYESGIVEPGPFRFLEIARFFGIRPQKMLTEDLSSPIAETGEVITPLPPEEDKYEVVELFIRKTEELQKIAEGFQAFHQLKKQRYAPDNADLQSLAYDYENLLEILNSLLEANRMMIKTL